MTGYKSPPRRRTPEVHITSRNAIRTRLLSDYGQGMTWKAVGAQFGISAGMAYRIAVTGYRPRSKAIRDRLPRPPARPRTRYKALFRFVWAAFLGSQIIQKDAGKIG